MKHVALILFLIVFSRFLKSQTNNIDFESTPVGTYTSANAVSGWTISSQVNGTVVGCNSNTVWTAGSLEFSIVSTPIVAFPDIGNIFQSPLGGNRVAKLNGSTSNSVTTKLSRTFSVTSSNSSLHFAFAGVFTGNNHGFCVGSNFILNILDQSGTVISCLTQSLAPGPGNQTANMSFSSSATAHWSNWQMRIVDLSQYINTVVTIEISAGDCQYGDHFGTLFFDADFPYVPPPVSYCGGLSPVMIISPVSSIYNYPSYSYPFLWYTTETYLFGSYTVGISQAYSPTLQIAYPTGNTYTIMNYFGACTPSYVYSISPTSVNIGTIMSTPSCINGGSGTATVVGIGSGGGYIYSWLNSTNSVVSTSSVLSNAAPGNYSVTLIAAGSASSTCGITTSVITIISNTIAPVTTLKSFCNITTTLNFSGGTNYQWHHNNSAIASTLGGTSSIYTVTTPTNLDTFAVAYNNTNGCRDSVNIILVSTTPGTISVNSNTAICLGSTNGLSVISLTPSTDASPGQNSYSVFSTGNTSAFSSSLNPTSAVTFTASGLSAGGTYSVVASDGLCQYSKNFIITPHTVNYNVTVANATLCAGNPVNASIYFGTPPTQGQYSYSWSPGAMINGNLSAANVIMNPSVSPGVVNTIIYTVVVTPSISNCPQTKTISVTFANPATPTIFPIPNLCYNGGLYTITAIPPGGKFINLTSTGINSITGVFDVALQLSFSNTFGYINSVGTCSATAYDYLIPNLPPTISVSGNTLFCEGESTTLLASGADNYLWSNGISNPSTSMILNSSTIFTVQGTSLSTNCSNTKTIAINVVSQPILTVTGNTLLCPRETATLIAGGADTYSWSNGSWSPVNLIFLQESTTTYTLTGTTSLASCSSTAQITVVNSDCNYVGLEKINLENSISIYPNPTNGKINMEFQHDISLVLHDAFGKILVERNFTEGFYTFDLSEYANGIYFLQMKGEKSFRTLKIIKTN